MEGNGGGGGLHLHDEGDHALPNGVGHAVANGLPHGGGQANHALANGGGHHALANGLLHGGGQAILALANGLLHGGAQANHALANGMPHALANGVPHAGEQAPAMEAGGVVVNGGLQVMAAPNANGMDPDGLYVAFLSLPAQDIARCRMVCRLWRDITATEEFLHDYHYHLYRTPMPLLFFQDPGLPRVNLRAFDIRGRVFRPVLRFPNQHQEEVIIHGSSAGILLLSSGDSLYACNPCTRRWAPLPPLHLHGTIIGFYATGINTAGFGCRVLYHDRGEPDCQYLVFELGEEGAAHPPRSIGRPGSGFYIQLEGVLANGIVPSYATPPVYFRGPVHVLLCWLLQAARANPDSEVLMFNTAQETFSLIPSPTIQVGGEDIPAGVGGQLFEMDGHLAMAVMISPARVDVWVSDITDLWPQWNHQYHIRLPADVINLNGGYHQNGMLAAVVFAIAQGPSVLVLCPRVLLHCDALGAVRRTYELGDQGTDFSPHTIQESLFLHSDVLQMEETDAVDGDPPFFPNE